MGPGVPGTPAARVKAPEGVGDKPPVRTWQLVDEDGFLGEALPKIPEIQSWAYTSVAYNGKVEKWQESLWGPKGGAVGTDNRIFYNVTELPLDQLRRTFGKLSKGPTRSGSVVEIPATVTNLSTKRAQDIGIKMRKYKLSGVEAQLADDVYSCNVLALDREEEGQLLDPPGEEDVIDMLNVVKAMIPSKVDEARVEADSFGTIYNDKYTPADGMMFYLYQVPSLSDRLDLQLEAFGRADFLSEKVFSPLRAFGNAAKLVIELPLLRDLMGRVLRALNGVRQGKQSAARKPLSSLRLWDSKSDKEGEEFAKAWVDTSEGTRPKLGEIIVQQMLSEGLQEGRYKEDGGLREHVRKQLLPGTKKPEDGTEPLNDSLLAREDSGIDSAWYRDVYTTLRASRNDLQRTRDLIKKDYATSTQIAKIAAWRLDVLVSGVSQAEYNLDEQIGAAAQNEKPLFAEAKRLSIKLGSLSYPEKGEHDELHNNADRELVEVRRRAARLLKFAGVDIKRPTIRVPDGIGKEEQKKLEEQNLAEWQEKKLEAATEILQNITGVLAKFWMTLKTQEDLQTRALSRTHSTKATGASIGVQLLSASTNNTSAQDHTREFARRVETRLGPSVRKLLRENEVNIPFASIETDTDPSILHAMQALAIDVLAN